MYMNKQEKHGENSFMGVTNHKAVFLFINQGCHF